MRNSFQKKIESIYDIAYRIRHGERMHAEKELPLIEKILKSETDRDVQKAFVKALFEDHIVWKFSMVQNSFFTFLTKELSFTPEDILECLMANNSPNIAFIHSLGKMGVDVSKPFKTKAGMMTPLMMAAMENNHEAMQTLQKFWPDPYVETELGTVYDPSFYISGQANDAIKQYKTSYDRRMTILNHKPDKRPYYDVIGTLSTTFNTESFSFRTPFYMALSGQFFDYIQRDIPQGFDKVWIDEIASAQVYGVNTYDALFHKYPATEIFNPFHWVHQQKKLKMFFDHMPAYYKRKSQTAYDACQSVIYNNKIDSYISPPRLKRRKKNT